MGLTAQLTGGLNHFGDTASVGRVIVAQAP
ncbi:uncharacterized protein METZ01_LOCUS186552, partial [marine metagenome]